MYYYIFLNNSIKELLDGELHTSNHINNKWNDLGHSLMVIETDEPLHEYATSVLENSLYTGQYLIELNESVLRNELEKIPYISYRSLSSELSRKNMVDVEDLFDRSKMMTQYSHLNAIFVSKLTKDMIKQVYRKNAVPPNWVQCEISNNKLIHKIK